LVLEAYMPTTVLLAVLALTALVEIVPAYP
jgi:hypothetical protein